MQDFNAAYAFVNALTNNNADHEIMDWRCIHDTDKKVPALPRRGTLSSVWPELCHWNQQGYGVFATVAAMDGQGNHLSNVQYIRAHYVDLDNMTADQQLQAAAGWYPAPSFFTNTSPNKYHVYWPVASYVGNDRFTVVQRKLRQMFDGDKAVIDAARVLRVPGTFNTKYITPHLVTCAALPGYGYGLAVESLEAATAHVNVIDGGHGERKELGAPELAAPSVAWLQRALDLSDPNNMDRSEWIAIAAAFKQAGWSLLDPESLYNMWAAWCARYDQNDVGENLKQWNSIRETEIGWKYISRKIPTIHLDGIDKAAYVPVAPVAPVVAGVAPVAATVVPPMPIPEPPALDCSGEFLTSIEQQQWFEGCTAIERTGEILVPSGRFMKPTQFNVRYGGKRFIINGAGKDTDEPWKAATRSTLWTIPKADHVRFLPELQFGEIIVDQLGRKGVNTYIPVQIKRTNGNPYPFLRHLELMIPNDEDRKIIVEYLAHNIKYPGYKIPWALMIQSTEGVGKGILQEMMERILGEMYCYTPKAQELVKSGSTFNAWMRAKLLIIVNEIKVDERRELIEILKPMITDRRVEVQSKGIDQEMEDNCANWIFFSNFKDAIPVNQNGRRYAIFYSAIQSRQDLLERQMNDRYFTDLVNWMQNGGSEIFADYLLNYPIERGALPGKAPHTSSMAEAVALSRGPIDRAIAEAIEDQLPGFKGGWVSATAASALIREKGIRTVSDSLMESIITGMGFKPVGRSLRPYFQEDRNSRSALFALDASAPLEWFAPAQGYE